MAYYAKLNRLPLGSIHARGWMLEQLLRNKDGMGGHLPELEPHMIATPYTTGESEESWGAKRRAGWGAEISGSYWNGQIQLAFTLNDPEMIAMADKWVEDTLKTARPDGYLGPYTDKDDMYDDFALYGTSRGMEALLSYYDATGKKEVLDAVHNCLLWFCDHWTGDKKTRYGAIGSTRAFSECYRYTGDERLVKFCEDYFDFLERNDLFGKSLSSLGDPQLIYNINHGAGYANSFGHPNEVYMMNGNPYYLSVAETAAKKARDKVLQKTGGITCDVEYLAPVGATVETEYCGITNYNYSNLRLLMSTGNPLYADEMERVVFNAGEGARKKDEKAIAYMTSPNQIFATMNSSNASGYMQVYSPCVPVSCCPVNAVRLLPEYVRGTVYMDDKKDIYFAAYCPMSVYTDALSFEIDTEYPFRDSLRITLKAEKPVCRKLYFRIPAWCREPSFFVNGEKKAVYCKSGEFAQLSGEWKDGDVIEVVLPMRVIVDHVNDSDRSSKFPLTVEYGPLLFALPIPEKWEETKGCPVTPLPDGWHWYNVNPVIPKTSLDVYDSMGQRRELISWNVALDEGLKAEEITVEETGATGYPWEDPPIRLKVPGWKAPFSYPPYPSKTPEPYGDHGKVLVTHPLTLELIPYGCTALRISYFARADR